jgi:hypothetical protein
MKIFYPKKEISWIVMKEIDVFRQVDKLMKLIIFMISFIHLICECLFMIRDIIRFCFQDDGDDE